MGPSVGQTGPCVYDRGLLLVREEAPVGPISPPTVKKDFLGQRIPPSLNTRGFSVGYRTICWSEGALRVSEGSFSVRLAFRLSKNIFLFRGAHLRLTEAFRRSEGALVGPWSPLSNKRTSDELMSPRSVLRSPPLFCEPTVGLQRPYANMRRLHDVHQTRFKQGIGGLG